MSNKLRTLRAGFIDSAARYPERIALEVQAQRFTYSELFSRAASLAATLQMHSVAKVALTAVFAHRSVVAFSGVLGALFHGHGYVPLNRLFPPERTRTMLLRSECMAMIVDSESAAQLTHVIANFGRPLTVLLPEQHDVGDVRKALPEHNVLGAADLIPSERWEAPDTDPSALAYLLFTSGSTGAPKGVMVSQRNVLSYLDYVVPRYRINEFDRCSQTFDMTFDLSAHDMFVTWQKGACLCCPDQRSLLKPGRFINDSKLTCWFSVPSLAMLMRRFGELKPAMYPGLRLSLFCGEALPADLATAWSKAAPASVVENIYGPTELTIACTAYRWDPLKSPGECEQGLVPIGYPFEQMQALIVDANLQEVTPGEDGELLMTGPQMSLGYWRDAEKTRESFIVPEGKNELYYRTGDRVRSTVNLSSLVYIGRMDSQVKIMGHRVELGEIEAIIREFTGIDAVVALGWPVTPSGAGAVEVFLQTSIPIDTAELRRQVAGRVPLYMVPRCFHVIPQMPLNANGKFDRNALLKQLGANSIPQ